MLFFVSSLNCNCGNQRTWIPCHRDREMPQNPVRGARTFDNNKRLESARIVVVVNRRTGSGRSQYDSILTVTKTEDTGKSRRPTSVPGAERDILINSGRLSRDREASNYERRIGEGVYSRMSRIDSSATWHGEKHCIALSDPYTAHNSKMVKGSWISEQNSILALHQEISDVEGSKEYSGVIGVVVAATG